MALLLGKLVAERLYQETHRRIEVTGIVPGLAVILVGNDPASHLYVGLKEKAAQKVGVYFEKKVFPETVESAEIMDTIRSLNAREDIHGILIQIPLPPGLPTDAIVATLDPEKDTDGFHPETLERFLAGDSAACPVFPRAILTLLRATGQSFVGERALAIVNSVLMGNVMVRALGNEGMEAGFVLRNEEQAVLSAKSRAAKVIVTACGTPRFLTGAMVSEGAVIIDGGIEHAEHRVVGDVDQESVLPKALFLSPVPGGVGPVTVATILARVTEAALTKRG